MAANDAVSMNVAENRQNVPMAIQENRAAVPMTVAEGGGAGGLNRKADKVTGAAAGNLAGLDSAGNLTDSGKAPEDFLEAPASAGTQGQVLTADGEGGASWQDPTGGDPTEIIDDNAGSGDTDKVWSADKSHELLTEINSNQDEISVIEQQNYFNLERYNPTETEISLSFTAGKYYKLDTGVLSTLATYQYTEKMQCNPGEVYAIDPHKGQMLFWKADGTYISYVSTKYNGIKYILTPAEAYYYAFNNSDTTICASKIIRVLTKDTNTTWVKRTIKSAPAKKIVNSESFINGLYTSTTDGSPTYNPSTLSGFYGSRMIRVVPGHHYMTATQTQLIFYGETGGFVSSKIPMNDPNYTGVECEMPFVIPANCYYVAINSRRSFEALYDLDYYDYGDKTPLDLEGKTIVCFGDSITGNYSYGDNYPGEIEQATGAKVYSVGFGGCRMELLNNDVDHTNPFSMVELADAIVSGTWTDQETYAAGIARNLACRLAILETIDFDDVDIITIAYGTNETGYPQDDENDPFNKYTYAGATRYAVKKLLDNYPHLRIVLLTPIYRMRTDQTPPVDSDEYENPSTHLKLTDNVQTLIDVGHEMKIPTIDLYYTLGINKWNWLEYFSAGDGTHPNSFGRKCLGRRIAGEMIRLFG